jgi:uncharacterized protein (TIGR03085 family)
MTLASDERAAISDEFERVGPDRPTLCAGWTTRDLLVHLLVRERKPWVAPGIVVPALSAIVDRASAGYAGTPWPDMVAALRTGPPPWSPFRIGRVDEFGNGTELFVHHEDVRRGEPGWEPRPPDPTRDSALWMVLRRSGRMLYRRSPVGLILRWGSRDEQCVVKTGPGAVIVVGEPGEIVLHAAGREATRVELRGRPDEVAALAGTSRTM